MTIEYLKEHGKDVCGVCEPVKIGRKYINQTVEGLRLWKCEGRYYWVEGEEFSIVYNTLLDG
jgi:hypothetical protein